MPGLMKRESLILIMLYFFTLTAAISLSSCGGGGGGDTGTNPPLDTTAPGEPTGLSAAAVSGNQIDLSWNANTDSDVASYRVYRGTSLINTVSHPTTTTSDTGLSPSTQYCYTVLAVDTSNNTSVDSTQACTTTSSVPDTQKPSMPGNFSVTGSGPTSVALSWTASTDNISVTGYKIYKGGTFLRNITSGTSSLDSGLTADTQYCYTVSAYDGANNESDQTASLCATPVQPVPFFIIATAGDGQNTIAWSEMSYTGSYNLYISTVAPVSKLTGSAVSMAKNPYVHTGLSNGTTYYYVVTGVGPGGESAESAQVSATPAVMPVATGKLPDTGQTTSYTTTAGEDSDYLISPPSYTENGDGTIKDNVTGLMWQKQDDGTNRTWYDAGTYCNNNTAGLPGTGWRVPTRMEFLSIVDYGACNPAINATFFPNTQGYYDYYWSASYDTAWPGGAKKVSFYNGATIYETKTVSHLVRCVRGQAQTTAGYTNNSNGTITDNVTGLMWQQQDDAATRSWLDALTYCENLSLASYTDWRLPNVKELSSLITDGRYDTTIDPLFTNTKTVYTDYYWTSSVGACLTSEAWQVSFNYGSTSADAKTDLQYVRCVRGQ